MGNFVFFMAFFPCSISGVQIPDAARLLNIHPNPSAPYKTRVCFPRFTPLGRVPPNSINPRDFGAKPVGDVGGKCGWKTRVSQSPGWRCRFSLAFPSRPFPSLCSGASRGRGLGELRALKGFRARLEHSGGTGSCGGRKEPRARRFWPNRREILFSGLF